MSPKSIAVKVEACFGVPRRYLGEWPHEPGIANTEVESFSKVLDSLTEKWQ